MNENLSLDDSIQKGWEDFLRKKPTQRPEISQTPQSKEPVNTQKPVETPQIEPQTDDFYQPPKLEGFEQIPTRDSTVKGEGYVGFDMADKQGNKMRYYRMKMPEGIKPLTINATPIINHATNRLAEIWYTGIDARDRYISGEEARPTVSAVVNALRAARSDEDFGKMNSSNIFYLLRSLDKRAYEEMPKTAEGALINVYEPEVLRVIKSSIAKHTPLNPEIKEGLMTDMKGLLANELERDTSVVRNRRTGEEEKERYDKAFRMENGRIIAKLFREIEKELNTQVPYIPEGKTEYLKSFAYRIGDKFFREYIKPYEKMSIKGMLSEISKNPDENIQKELQNAVNTRLVIGYLNNLFLDKYGITFGIPPSSLDTPGKISEMSAKSFSKTPQERYEDLLRDLLTSQTKTEFRKTGDMIEMVIPEEDILNKGCGKKEKKKMHECVADVEDQGKSEDSAYAICTDSIKKTEVDKKAEDGFNEWIKSHPKKKSYQNAKDLEKKHQKGLKDVKKIAPAVMMAAGQAKGVMDEAAESGANMASDLAGIVTMTPGGTNPKTNTVKPQKEPFEDIQTEKPSDELNQEINKAWKEFKKQVYRRGKDGAYELVDVPESSMTPEERKKAEARKRRTDAYGVSARQKKKMRDTAYRYQGGPPVDYSAGENRKQPESWKAGKITGLQRSPLTGAVETYKLPRARRTNVPVAEQTILNTGDYRPPEEAAPAALGGMWHQMANRHNDHTRQRRKWYDDMKEKEKKEYAGK